MTNNLRPPAFCSHTLSQTRYCCVPHPCTRSQGAACEEWAVWRHHQARRPLGVGLHLEQGACLAAPASLGSCMHTRVPAAPANAALAAPIPAALGPPPSRPLSPRLSIPLHYRLQDWVKQLDYEESLRKQMAEGKEGKDAQGGGDGKGFLSLTGKVDLNSMDVDLSAQLRARKKSGGEASPSQQQAQGKQAPRRRVAPKYDSVPPTRLEQRIWERSGKFSRRVVPVAPTNEVELVRAWMGLSDDTYWVGLHIATCWCMGAVCCCVLAHAKEGAVRSRAGRAFGTAPQLLCTAA